MTTAAAIVVLVTLAAGPARQPVEIFQFDPHSTEKGNKESIERFVNEQRAKIGLPYGDLKFVGHSLREQRVSQWIGDVFILSDSATVWQYDDGSLQLWVNHSTKGDMHPKAIAKAKAFRLVEYDDALRDFTVALLKERSGGLFGSPDSPTTKRSRALGTTPRAALQLQPMISAGDPNLYVYIEMSPKPVWLCMSGPPDWRISSGPAPGGTEQAEECDGKTQKQKDE
jgi:hypothetical protein